MTETQPKPLPLSAEELAAFVNSVKHNGGMAQQTIAVTYLARIVSTIDALQSRLADVERERDGEREARGRIDSALRQKDAAMGVLVKRLSENHIDCSDLMS